MDRLSSNPIGDYHQQGNTSLPSTIHQQTIVKLEPATIPIYPGQPIGRNGVVKFCGVCGDIAKSYHFGGLSCDSCKAFFRRSVQNDVYLHFQCCHRGQCIISLSNRKNCQYCRMKRCFDIGMEKSWVMTEEERKALMKARAEKKLSKQLAASATSTTTSGKPLFSYSDDYTSSCSDYKPHIDRMTDFLEPVEIKEIESIVTKYLHAYQHVPYRTELKYFDHDRPGTQVMEMFGTLIRRFAFYARLLPDFSALAVQDQSALLKGGVLEMCVLRGALVFDPLKNLWPNSNMSMYKDAPVLKLDNIGHLTSTRIFQLHMEFISCIQQMGVDEPTIMLLVLIVLFTPERAGLVKTNWVEKYQAYYTSLLERYMNWRFGTRAKFMFAKLLTKLSDLREFSDTHNRENIKLGSDEISSIQHQLKHVKINPFPECSSIVPEDPNINPSMFAFDPSESTTCQGFPDNNTSPSSSPVRSNYDTMKSNMNLPVQSQQTCVGNHQDTLLYKTSMPHYEQPPSTQQPHSASYPSTRRISLEQQYNTGREPSSLSSLSPYSSSYGSNGNYQCGLTILNSGDSSGQFQQQQPALASMTIQFMKAVQQSVNQVVSAPYFGYEWIKPDYHFDPIGDNEIVLETLSSSPTTIQRTSDSFSQGDPSPLIESKSISFIDSPANSEAVNSAVNLVEAEAATLSPRAMDELYEALEEYSEFYN